MHNFRKFLISSFSIAFIFILISYTVITPFLNSEHGYYQDAKLREQTKGKIDTIVIGASNSLEAYNMNIIDRELECYSYNLSQGLMPLNTRNYFLEKEITRNPVKRVIIDISYQTLVRDEDKEFAAGDETTLGRLDNTWERLYYILNYVSFDDWLNIYSRQFVLGLEYWKSRMLKLNEKGIIYDLKGFHPVESNDVTLSKEEAILSYENSSVNLNFLEKNLKKLEKSIKICQDSNAEVILAVAPLPNSSLWKEKGYDEFYEWFTNFANEHDCVFYDFNLLKNRYEIFDDKYSFLDSQHLSSQGAATYTKEFCKLIKISKSQDVSKYFYDSFVEMKKDSPYMKFIK